MGRPRFVCTDAGGTYTTPTPTPGFGVILGAFFMVLTNPTNAGEGSDMPGGGCADRPPDIGPQRCRPFRKSKKGCTCFAACNIETQGKNPPKIYPQHSNGIGTGNDCREAKDNAEDNAKWNFDAFTGGRVLGLKTKHCHPLRCKDH